MSDLMLLPRFILSFYLAAETLLRNHTSDSWLIPVCAFYKTYQGAWDLFPEEEVECPGKKGRGRKCFTKDVDQNRDCRKKG